MPYCLPEKQFQSMKNIIMSFLRISLNHIGPILAQGEKENGWHYFGTRRACLGKGVGSVGNKVDEKNDIESTSFVNVGPTKLPIQCQRWPNE